MLGGRAIQPVLVHEFVQRRVAAYEVEDGLVLAQEASARGVVLLRRDGVADVGAFEVVECEDERVEVGEFGDALAVAVRVREAHFLVEVQE